MTVLSHKTKNKSFYPMNFPLPRICHYSIESAESGTDRADKARRHLNDVVRVCNGRVFRVPFELLICSKLLKGPCLYVGPDSIFVGLKCGYEF